MLNEEDVVTDLPEKVYTQEDARLFRASADVCGLTNPWYDLTGVSLEIDNPVDLLDPELKRIGFASLYKDGDKLKADLFFRYDCPERLDIDSGQLLYVEAVGVVQMEPKPSINRILSGAKPLIYALSIHAVRISRRSSYMNHNHVTPWGL